MTFSKYAGVCWCLCDRRQGKRRPFSFWVTNAEHAYCQPWPATPETWPSLLLLYKWFWLDYSVWVLPMLCYDPPGTVDAAIPFRCLLQLSHQAADISTVHLWSCPLTYSSAQESILHPVKMCSLLGLIGSFTSEGPWGSISLIPIY